MSEDTHKLTVYMTGNTTLTTSINQPDIVRKQLIGAIHEYYSYRWPKKRRKTSLEIGTMPVTVVPIDKLICFKIEQY